jgi:hypothetical protein
MSTLPTGVLRSSGPGARGGAVGWYLPPESISRGGLAVDDKSLYAAILGLTAPWGVEKVELRLADGEVHVWVALPTDTL